MKPRDPITRYLLLAIGVVAAILFFCKAGS